MKTLKLKISNEKKDINTKFYTFFKCIIKLKLSAPQMQDLIENLELLKNKNTMYIVAYLSNLYLEDKRKTKNDKITNINHICTFLQESNDVLLLIFTLQLYEIKDLLLAEAKIASSMITSNMNNIHPLSVQYDTMSISKPYQTRVNGALFSLLFFDHIHKQKFNLISEEAENYLKELSKKAILFKNLGLETNQIFILLLSESIDQSIKSDSGSNYENRVSRVLSEQNITSDTHKHDKNDLSTEFDFFFTINNKVFGVSAKRTLRERYKQFIKTAYNDKSVDIMVEITLGLDITEQKAKTIVQHGVYLFVAKEIYESRNFLHNIKGVFSSEEFTYNTFTKLSKSTFT